MNPPREFKSQNVKSHRAEQSVRLRKVQKDEELERRRLLVRVPSTPTPFHTPSPLNDAELVQLVDALFQPTATPATLYSLLQRLSSTKEDAFWGDIVPRIHQFQLVPRLYQQWMVGPHWEWLTHLLTLAIMLTSSTKDKRIAEALLALPTFVSQLTQVALLAIEAKQWEVVNQLVWLMVHVSNDFATIERILTESGSLMDTLFATEPIHPKLLWLFSIWAPFLVETNHPQQPRVLQFLLHHIMTLDAFAEPQPLSDALWGCVVFVRSEKVAARVCDSAVCRVLRCFDEEDQLTPCNTLLSATLHLMHAFAAASTSEGSLLLSRIPFIGTIFVLRFLTSHQPKLRAVAVNTLGHMVSHGEVFANQILLDQVLWECLSQMFSMEDKDVLVELTQLVYQLGQYETPRSILYKQSVPHQLMALYEFILPEKLNAEVLMYLLEDWYGYGKEFPEFYFYMQQRHIDQWLDRLAFHTNKNVASAATQLLSGLEAFILTT